LGQHALLVDTFGNITTRWAPSSGATLTAYTGALLKGAGRDHREGAAAGVWTTTANQVALLTKTKVDGTTIYAEATFSTPINMSNGMCVVLDYYAPTLANVEKLEWILPTFYDATGKGRRYRVKLNTTHHAAGYRQARFADPFQADDAGINLAAITKVRISFATKANADPLAIALCRLSLIPPWTDPVKTIILRVDGGTTPQWAVMDRIAELGMRFVLYHDMVSNSNYATVSQCLAWQAAGNIISTHASPGFNDWPTHTLAEKSAEILKQARWLIDNGLTSGLGQTCPHGGSWGDQWDSDLVRSYIYIVAATLAGIEPVINGFCDRQSDSIDLESLTQETSAERVAAALGYITTAWGKGRPAIPLIHGCARAFTAADAIAVVNEVYAYHQAGTCRAITPQELLSYELTGAGYA